MKQEYGVRGKRNSGSSFGDLVKKQRESMGMKQGELAKEAKVSATLLSQYESGKMRPEQLKVDNLIKLGRALGLSPAFLMNVIDGTIRVEIED